MGFVILRDHNNRICGVVVDDVWGQVALGRLAKSSLHSEDRREQFDRDFVETHCAWGRLSYLPSYLTTELGPCKRLQWGFMLSVSFLIPQE
jgi:hypothetical protein